MRCVEALMLFLFPRHHGAEESGARLVAELRRARTANRLKTEVAQSTVDTTERHLSRIRGLSVEIQRCEADQKAKWRDGRTSGVRNLVADMLESLDAPKGEDKVP